MNPHDNNTTIVKCEESTENYGRFAASEGTCAKNLDAAIDVKIASAPGDRFEKIYCNYYQGSVSEDEINREIAEILCEECFEVEPALLAPHVKKSIPILRGRLQQYLLSPLRSPDELLKIVESVASELSATLELDSVNSPHLKVFEAVIIIIVYFSQETAYDMESFLSKYDRVIDGKGRFLRFRDLEHEEIHRLWQYAVFMRCGLVLLPNAGDVRANTKGRKGQRLMRLITAICEGKDKKYAWGGGMSKSTACRKAILITETGIMNQFAATQVLVKKRPRLEMEGNSVSTLAASAADAAAATCVLFSVPIPYLTGPLNEWLSVEVASQKRRCVNPSPLCKIGGGHGVGQNDDALPWFTDEELEFLREVLFSSLEEGEVAEKAGSAATSDETLSHTQITNFFTGMDSWTDVNDVADNIDELFAWVCDEDLP